MKRKKPRKRWVVTVTVGTPLWTHSGYSFRLGDYRWFWVAWLVAKVHLLDHPFRVADIEEEIEPLKQA